MEKRGSGVTEQAETNGAHPATELVIPVDLAQAIVNYLATRPYVEVFEFIHQIQQLQPHEPD